MSNLTTRTLSWKKENPVTKTLVTPVALALAFMASPALAQYIPAGTTVTGGPASPVIFSQGGQTTIGQPVLLPGQYREDGRTYNPASRVEVVTSGCSSNTLNAIACMGAQGLFQAFVNRSAIREQRDATIAVESSRFTLQGSGTAGYPPAGAGPQMVWCTLTENGQTQRIRMTLSECEAEARMRNTTAERRN